MDENGGNRLELGGTLSPHKQSASSLAAWPTSVRWLIGKSSPLQVLSPGIWHSDRMPGVEGVVVLAV